MKPGDRGGDCPICEVPTRMVGYGEGVVGVWCDECDLFVPIFGRVWADSPAFRAVGEERRETNVWEGRPLGRHPYGPDPWP